MKKKIGIIIILLFEFLLLGLYGLQFSITINNFFGHELDICKFFYQLIVLKPSLLLHLDSYSFGKLLTLIIVNVAFIVVYFTVFCTVGVILKSRKRKKVYRVVKVPYELNEAEEERFSYKNYLKKFPTKRVISLIIPVSFIVLFILMRYDIEFSSRVNFFEVGIFDTYSRFIDPFIQKVFNNTDSFTNVASKVFTNEMHIGYADLINKLPESVAWLEYIILVLFAVLILAIWFGFFTLFNLFFKKTCAKRKAKKARENYIFKKDYKEYKYRIKHAKEYSSKSEKFMSLVEDNNKDNQVIADSKNAKKLKRENDVPEDYYDDLGNGVRDLGVGEIEKENPDKAKTEREVRYISDKDFDITLEAEPVIEVVEDDEIDPIHQQSKEDELFYEKYQQDEVEIKDYENYSKDRQIISDYVSSINDNVNNNEVSSSKEGQIEEQEVQDEPIEVEANIENTEVVQETKVEENIEPNEDKVREEPKEEVSKDLSPLEKYRLEKKKEKEELLKERQKLIDEGTLTEENDPLKKFRKVGARSGKVETKVPTVKEQEKEKERKALERKQNRLNKQKK